MSKKYNILFIVSDQEQGKPLIPKGFALPNHERLKKMGVHFRNYHVNTTLCTPSRACIYTGTQVPTNKMFDNENFSFVNALDPKIPTFGTMLREAAGYQTTYKGKWHVGKFDYRKSKSDQMEQYGFSEYQTFGDTHGGPHDGMKNDPLFAKEAVEWLKKNARAVTKSEKPWCLTVNFINPHDIMFFKAGDAHKPALMNTTLKPKDNPLYDKIWDLELPKNLRDDLKEQPDGVRGYYESQETLFGIIDMNEEAAWKDYRNYYFNCMMDGDANLGAVLDALEASGDAKDTIIFYTSDHGEMAGGHQLTQKGNNAFEELVAVPLIISHPDGGHGEVCEGLVASVDLAPTILGMAGVPEAELKKKYPTVIGDDISALVMAPKTAKAPRGSPTAPGKGAFFSWDCLFTVDAPWVTKLNEKTLEVDIEGYIQNPPDFYIRDFPRLFKELGLPDLKKRNMLRGVFDGRYKMIRYFALNKYHQPKDVEELLANNSVGLYDLETDPDEMVNLAHPSRLDKHRDLLKTMNDKLNQLTKAEIPTGDEGPFGLK